MRRPLARVFFGIWGALLWPALAAAAGLPGKLGIQSFPVSLAREIGLDDESVAIYLVAHPSPAAIAGLKPGDQIVAIDGNTVDTFDELATRVRDTGAGKKVQLDIRRDGDKKKVELTLAAFTGDMTVASHESLANYLKTVPEPKRGPHFWRELADAQWNAGARTQAFATLSSGRERYPQDAGLRLAGLEYLVKSGDFNRFVEEASKAAKEFSDEPGFRLFGVEALMASGRLREAELAAESLARSEWGLFTGLSDVGAEAVLRWSLARLRQGKSLQSPSMAAAIVSSAKHKDKLAMFQHWRQTLNNKPTYQIDPKSRRSTLPFHKSSVLMNLVPQKMHGITVSVNGVEVPLAIVDTGASHTLLSNAVARKAGLRLSEASRTATGSLNFTARTAVVDELRLGDVVLHDVPVTVGDPPPLVMTKAQAALGVDLMHHVRFTLDYAREQVTVEPARQPDGTPIPDNADKDSWGVPLWTFSDHVLSQIELADGTFARVLIDSGNFAQTLVFPDWAGRNIAGHTGNKGNMLFYAFSNPISLLKGAKLAGRPLPDWPVMDVPPISLQGIDLFDLLMGHDLLSQHRVTIDMLHRRLRLEQGPKPLASPTTLVPVEGR